MERLQIPHLLDERGQPFGARLECRLRSFIPQLRLQFPALRNDELQLTLVLEEGGRRLTGWEQRSGRPLDEQSLRFAWTVVFNIARSWMLRDANRMRRDTIGAEAGEAILSTLPAINWGTAQQIEDAVRLREAHDKLSEDQQMVCGLKEAGYSAIDIAEKRGCSPDAVNMVFSRAKRKLDRLLRGLPAGASGRRPERRAPGPSPEASSPDSAHTGRLDGELAPAPRLVGVHRRE